MSGKEILSIVIPVVVLLLATLIPLLVIAHKRKIWFKRRRKRTALLRARVARITDREEG